MVLPDIRISPMTQPWDAALQRLLLEGVLSGFALIDLNGESVASYGALCDEPIVAQQLQSLFQTAAAPGHLDICGQQAIIIQRSDSSVYAVSRGKQLGMTAHYLPSGILVTVFNKPNLPQTVAPLVESACERLRQP